VSEQRLVDLSVSEFVEAVASANQPAPAAGSVSALSGAACAALLELACGVRGPADCVDTARGLRRALLGLIDQDAAAVEAWLRSPRAPEARRQALAVPLAIARACGEVVALAADVEPHSTGAVRFDVVAAQQLARAAALAALDLVEANLRSDADRTTLQDEIDRVRASLGASAAS
jgi:formiminotetrahydrofolate cyclodeaminase